MEQERLVEQLLRDNRELQQEMKRLLVEFTAFRAETARTLNAISEHLARINGRINQLEDDTGELRDRLAEVERQQAIQEALDDVGTVVSRRGMQDLGTALSIAIALIALASAWRNLF